MNVRISVTFEEMRDAIEGMHAALPKFGLTAENLPQLVRIYREVLEAFDGEVVRGAAKMLLNTSPKFPTPNAWREACATWRKHNRIFLERQPEMDSDGNDIACHTCRAVARWAILRMIPTPFSLPMTEPRKGMQPGETRRRIVVCDPDRHHTPHGVSALPENFLRWEA